MKTIEKVDSKLITSAKYKTMLEENLASEAWVEARYKARELISNTHFSGGD